MGRTGTIQPAPNSMVIRAHPQRPRILYELDGRQVESLIGSEYEDAIKLAVDAFREELRPLHRSQITLSVTASSSSARGNGAIVPSEWKAVSFKFEKFQVVRINVRDKPLPELAVPMLVLQDVDGNLSDPEFAKADAAEEEELVARAPSPPRTSAESSTRRSSPPCHHRSSHNSSSSFSRPTSNSSTTPPQSPPRSLASLPTSPSTTPPHSPPKSIISLPSQLPFRRMFSSNTKNSKKLD